MIPRLVHKADFERLLALPPMSRSAHFALHHAPRCAALPAASAAGPGPGELSTDTAPTCPRPVDDCPGTGLRLGVIVPKKHARRAVTRNLVKRQIRSALERRAGPIAPGDYLVRLRAPLPRTVFVSAASDALAATLAAELDGLLAVAAGRPARAVPRTPARPASGPAPRPAPRQASRPTAHPPAKPDPGRPAR